MCVKKYVSVVLVVYVYMKPMFNSFDTLKTIFLIWCIMTEILNVFIENSVRRVPMGVTDEWPALVHVMAWCCQATSHYQNP